MSDKRDLIKFFHEERLTEGRPVKPDLTEGEKREFDLLELIWNDSVEASKLETFDSSGAWEKVAGVKPEPVQVIAEEEVVVKNWPPHCSG